MARRIGVIGGSGLYAMEGLEVDDEVRLDTPFGPPSDAFVLGRLDGKPVAFLARHGRGHRYPPAAVPYRANIFAFRLLGVDHLISVSAVGSMRERIEPRHLVVPDQFIDRTRGRASTFFDEPGLVAHVALADPVCSWLCDRLAAAASEADIPLHVGGTYLCIDGPQFSTRAESLLYRSWGVDVIGMTNATEARLAREAEIAYATLAMACDYDCWHDRHDDVTADMAIANLTASVSSAQKVLRGAVATIPLDRPADCAGSLGAALLTDPSHVPVALRRKLGPLIERYIGAAASEPQEESS